MSTKIYQKIINPNKDMCVQYQPRVTDSGDVVQVPVFFRHEPDREKKHLSAHLLDIDELISSENTALMKIRYSRPLGLDDVESFMDTAEYYTAMGESQLADLQEKLNSQEPSKSL